MAKGVANFISFCSIPGVRNSTTLAPEKPSFILSQSSFHELVGGCVGYVNYKSINALKVTRRGFHTKQRKYSMPVSKFSQHKAVSFHVGNLASLDFQRFCREGKVEAALDAMNEMEKNGVFVDSLDLIELLQICEDMKLLETGKRVFEYTMRSPSKPHIAVFNKFVEMYCKLGDTSCAKRVFEEMPKRNLDSWNKMLVGLAENGEGAEALRIFSMMKKDGVMPDESTFVGVIMACRCVGAVEDGQEHFVSMSRDYGITPSMEHYVAIVDLLGKSKKITEAKELIANMPIEPSSCVWETLENAFCNAKKRYWARINGLPCNISLPDPDIYIDQVDWNSSIDPELLLDLEQEQETPDEVDKDEKVVILGDSLLNKSFSCTGWGEDEEELQKAADLSRHPGNEGWDCKVDDDHNPWENSNGQNNGAMKDYGWGSHPNDSQAWNKWKNSCYEWENNYNGAENVDDRSGGNWGTYDDNSRKKQGSPRYMSRYKTSRFAGNDYQRGSNEWRNGRGRKKANFSYVVDNKPASRQWNSCGYAIMDSGEQRFQ